MARGNLGPQVTPDFWRERYHCWTPFRVEGLKLLLDELAADSGVEVRFFTTVIDADARADTVNGVVVHNIEGLRYIRAKTFVDCTGDAVLADLCGVECRTNPAFMPGTLCSLHAGIDWERLKTSRMARARSRTWISAPYSQLGILSSHRPGGKRSLRV